jgi:hypothetical protein
LDELLPCYVRDNGGKEFFKKANWRRELNAIVDQYKKVDMIRIKEGRLNRKHPITIECVMNWLNQKNPRAKPEKADYGNLLAGGV